MPISPLWVAKFQIRLHILIPTSDFLLVFKRNETPMCNRLGDIGRFSITGSDVMPISKLGAPNFKSDLIFRKPISDLLLVVKRNETPICKGLGYIGRVSITGSDVMPISQLGGAKFQIRPHILKER